MQEDFGDTPAPPSLHQHVTFSAAVTFHAPSTSVTNGMEGVTTLDSDDDDSDTTGPPEETPEREADATDGTHEEQLETPQSSALADETAAPAAQYVDAFKPDDGCATPPPPPAHDSVGSDDGRSSPHGEKQKPASVGASGKRPGVAAAKSRPVAFRSFSWDKKGRKSGYETSPDGRAPSPGEHHLPADGKAWEEAGAEHKEKGKARWKRLWK